IAIEPAASSARPAVTIIAVGFGALPRPPVSPAASAKGTVKPSDMPMTTSRTTSPAVKWRSICGVCGMNLLVRSKFWGRWMISLKQLRPTPRFSICHLSELAEKHQHANDDKGHGSHALDPFERQIITEHASSQNADGGNGREGERCGDEHGPGLF